MILSQEQIAKLLVERLKQERDKATVFTQQEIEQTTKDPRLFALRSSLLLPCVMLGEALPNQTCGCKEKIRKCEEHGYCTTEKLVNNYMCCRFCPDYISRESIMPGRRHLLYFIFPVKGDVWKKNVKWLKQYIDLFNGRRIIAICSQPPSKKWELESPDTVASYCGKKEFEFITVSQIGQKRLGEVTAFVPLMERVKHYTRDYDVTFYAHAKGVVSSKKHPGALIWAKTMYECNLGLYSRHIRPLLQTYKIVGAFRAPGEHWHYGGTFFWFRNRDVFNRDWRNVPMMYGGVEFWPNLMFSRSESGCVFGDGILPVQLYNKEYAKGMYHEYKRVFRRDGD